MYLYVKRLLDIVFGGLILVILSPLLLVIALIVKLDDPSGPVFFKQKRFGRGKKLFDIYKFRSMKMDAPHDVATQDLDDPEKYVTRIGGFLRRSSLDELPQLLNVVRGDMSLVSPRPALWNQTHLIAERDKYQGRYHKSPNDLRPGITGWAQIHGRDDNDDEEKASLDGYYVRHLSFGMDVKCLFDTIDKVIRHEGVKG